MTSPKIEAVACVRKSDLHRAGSGDEVYLNSPDMKGDDDVLLYPQQTVDALLADVERITHERDAIYTAIGNEQVRQFTEKFGEPIPLIQERDAAIARAERAEAQAEANRRDAERYRYIAADHSLAWEEEPDAEMEKRNG